MALVALIVGAWMSIQRRITLSERALRKDLDVLKSWAGNVIFGRALSDELVHEPMGRDYMIARDQGRLPVNIALPSWPIWAHAKVRPMEGSLLVLGVDPTTFKPNGDPVELKDLEPLTTENQTKIKALFMRASTKFGDTEVPFIDFVEWAVSESVVIAEDAKMVAAIARSRPGASP
jgi:hypothetical protein